MSIDLIESPVKATKSQSVTHALWRFNDVMIVAAFVLLAFVAAGVVHFLLDRGSAAVRIVWLFAALTAGLVPIVWLRRKHHLRIDVLGLRRGRVGVGVSIMLGIIIAFLYSFAVEATLLGADSEVLQKAVIYPPIRYLFMTLTLNGLLNLAVGPFSEEILFRGFLYGYLRPRLGLWLGMVAQALVFALVHAPTSATRFILFIVVGLILGSLYEITGSVTSSVVCHSVMNYYMYVFVFIKGVS
jgi:membrane protease YdiL (CAAX protease family)